MASQEFLNLVEPDEAEKKGNGSTCYTNDYFQNEKRIKKKTKKKNNFLGFFFLLRHGFHFVLNGALFFFLILAKNLVFNLNLNPNRKYNIEPHKFKL